MPNNENENKKMFLKKLSSKLIERDYSIVNGYGLGVGSSIIEGALTKIYEKEKNVSECLKLFPFPRDISKKEEREIAYRKYRISMCSEANYQIIVFGNKKNEKGEIVDSNGIEEEFNIAFERNLFVIPVASTGCIAEKIWEKMSNNLNDYGYKSDSLKENFKKLKEINYTNDEIFEVINNIIKEVKNEQTSIF